MNETTKSKIKAKNSLYKKYIHNGRFESDFVYLENLIIELKELISSTKALHYENLEKKLNNPLSQVTIGQFVKHIGQLSTHFITTKKSP